MIPKGLLTQAAVLVLSVGIILSYIKPTFDTIAARQSEIETYKSEQEKVRGVNTKLANLSSAVNAITITDQRRLLTYMPDTVDTVAVPRALEAIAETAGLTIVEISAEDEDAPNPVVVEGEMADVVVKPTAASFALKVECTYDELKNFLSLVEQNEFPLEVTHMEVSQTDTGVLAVEFLFTTYSHTDNSLTENVTIEQTAI